MQGGCEVWKQVLIKVSKLSVYTINVKELTFRRDRRLQAALVTKASASSPLSSGREASKALA